jgi:DNA-binding PucR family transcriptional regulator
LAADEIVTRLEMAAGGLPPAAREAGALAGVVGGQLAALWPLPAAPGDRPLEPPPGLLRLADELQHGLAGRGLVVAGGVGRGHGGLDGAARSRAEAAGALWAAWNLFAGSTIARYSDLGLYRLLLPLRTAHGGELRLFYEETLGPLITEGESGTKLLDTLDAYLAHGGNVSETAAALYLHRNTLSYRLRRITEISGLDLTDPAVCLRVQVALAVRRLL